MGCTELTAILNVTLIIYIIHYEHPANEALGFVIILYLICGISIKLMVGCSELGKILKTVINVQIHAPR